MAAHSQKTAIETLTLPSFGECTLLPLDTLPENFRTYEKLAVTASELDLKELPPLTHSNLQEIFFALVHALSHTHIGHTSGVTVWLSGVHDAYAYVDIRIPNQQKEKCISALELYFLGNTEPMDMYVAEILITERREIEFDDVVYGLFLGA